MAITYLSWKRYSIFNLVYLQEILSDLSVGGVKIYEVYGQKFRI